MMRKITYIMPLLALAVLCSCGVKDEDKQTQKKETVEMAEPATTAIFKNSETTEKTDYLENDYIRVWENYDNEFKEFDSGLHYLPHMTMGKLPTVQLLENAFNDIKSMDDTFSTIVKKESAEMVGDSEESIIVIEKELI